MRTRKIAIKITDIIKPRENIKKEEQEESKDGQLLERFTLVKPLQLQPLPNIELPIKLPKLQLKSPQPFQVNELKQLLSNERVRLLALIKTKKPSSIYNLAKLAGRDFKAVRQDLKLLEKFGLIRLAAEKDQKTKKKRLKPILALDRLQITLEF